MARDTTDETRIANTEELAAHLAEGSKPESAWRIGTEHEKFPFYTEHNSPVPYDGPRGIRAILEGMQSKLGWEPIIDEGNIIGLVEPTGQGAISLEPGGQFELSGARFFPSIRLAANPTLTWLRSARLPNHSAFVFWVLAAGSPKWTLAETPRMPRSRYNIMSNYMPKVGKDGLNMMYRTCTIQVNLDFSSETDMRRKMQVSVKLQSIATALFAMSPFTEGKPNGLLSWRSEIWRDTDNNRSGVLPFIFNENFGFADYVEWALDVPMYFVMRHGRYHDCTHVTFRQFMNGALTDSIPESTPNMGDWANHLQRFFPRFG